MLTISLCCTGCFQKTTSWEKGLAPLRDLSQVDIFKSAKAPAVLVNDYDSIFKPAEKEALTRLLINYEDNTSRQIVIVTVHHLYDYQDIQRLATDLGNYWGVGQTEEDNGLLLLLCKPERQIAIATGLGTEQVLTDSICKRVIDHHMIPYFKEEAYFKGIQEGVLTLISRWK
ncbi:MAG: TPM domain-containing protein [Bacteroidota bacterium]